MSGSGAWFVGLLLAIGPNGWWVDARVDAVDDVYRDLVPLEWLDDTPASLWIAFHRRDDWVMAAYLPPGAVEMTWARTFPQVAASQFDRLLPGLEVPRLILREDVYRATEPDQNLVALETLAVDSGEILYNALLDAHVDLAGRRGEAWTVEMESRARQVMASVPEAHRVEAFRNAVVDFGSHVMSLAGEIARQSRRHSPAKLCALLDPPLALFRSWQRALDDGQFPGRWQRPKDPATGMPGESSTTREVLRAGDKRWVISQILGAPWTGEPAVDFAILCEPATGPELLPPSQSSEVGRWKSGSPWS